MATRPVWSNEAFLEWCQSLKPCKYCRRKFIGPICPCETKDKRP